MNRNSIPLGILGCCLLFWSANLWAEVKLPGIFSDHMVLQREQAVPIWGTATPGEKVTVKFRNQEKSAVADATGQWQVKLDPLTVGGPDQLVVSAGQTVTIHDVLVGEVWVGSGQSNMGAAVRWATGVGDTGMLALVAAGPYPEIREFGINGFLQQHVPGRWRVADTNSVPTFSGLLFAFGVRLHRELGVPVGLVIASVSGSPAGTWLSDEALKNDAACQAAIRQFATAFDSATEQKQAAVARAKWQEAVAEAKAQKKPEPQPPCPARVPGEVYCNKVGVHFETYLRPVIPYGIRGVLWDQGENGTGVIGLPDPYLLMGALFRGWRQAWGQGDFPFIYVQKNSGGGCAWDSSNPVMAKAEPFAPLPATCAGPAIVGAYLKLLDYPKIGMAISSDLGSGQHPINKSGYGQRAADVALGMVYGKPIQYYGPMYESHKIEGGQIRVTFKEVGQGLAFKHGDKLQGFAISENGQYFVWAEATIEGNSVVVSSPKIKHPVAVWYGWSSDRPWANLFNKDGLPAIPFRTNP